MISLVHFDAVFNRQETRTVTGSLETWTSWFNHETNLTITVQKLSKKLTVRLDAIYDGLVHVATLMMLHWQRSSSMVRSQVHLGRPVRRCHSPGEWLVLA